jgi:GNAT superfamily N-acetyltransferase
MINDTMIQKLIDEGYSIITGREAFDVVALQPLYAQMYWANTRPAEIIEKSLDHSLLYGVEMNGQIVAFSRWVTDYATYAYLCDVIVDEGHRGKGLAKWMLSEALSRPDLSTMRRLSLVTQDAHGVYEAFGFKLIEHAERYMELFRG